MLLPLRSFSYFFFKIARMINIIINAHTIKSENMIINALPPTLMIAIAAKINIKNMIANIVNNIIVSLSFLIIGLAFFAKKEKSPH